LFGFKTRDYSANLAFGDKYKIISDPRLREANYGDFAGTPTNSFKNNLEKYLDKPFPNGESYHDVKRRMVEFLQEIYPKYQNQHVAIIAHQATQFALERIANGKSWPEIIADDWRKTKSWQPGWDYIINDENLYPCRIGAYGVIQNNDGMLAIVKTDHNNYFLPGGGVEKNETPEECVKRECMEELGFDVEVKEKIGLLSCAFFSSKSGGNIKSTGHFFICKLNKTCAPTEDGNTLVWLSPTDAVKMLYTDNQKKIIEKLI